MPRYNRTNQFSALSDPGRYTSGQGTKVFVSKPYLLNQRTPFRELTLVNGLSQGDVFIAVAVGCDQILYEGTRIDFGTSGFPRAVFVATETPAGLTTIPIWKSRYSIAAGATAKLEAYIPVFSAKTANADNQLQAFTDQNFSSYASATNPNGISPQGSITGVVVKGDPGHKILTEASKQGKICKIEIIDDFSHGGDWAEASFGINKQRAVNQYNQVTYTIFPIRSWASYDDPPELRLSINKDFVSQGGSFTVTFESANGGNYGYTITGVNSSDIGGEPLTGTFSGAIDTLTITIPAAASATPEKIFRINLNDYDASATVLIASFTPFYTLQSNLNSLTIGQTAIITFNTNSGGSTGYTITGVTSADINNAPLTGTFTANGQTLSISATNNEAKTLTIALGNGEASESISLLAPVYNLTANNTELAPGESVIFTYTTNSLQSAGYTITGVTSANINNAPLTGTFTANGETLTLTSASTEAKTLTLALNNGKAASTIQLLTPIYELTASAESLYVGRSFTVTLTTNSTQPTAYTITGVNSADIDNAPLTGFFSGDGDSRTYTMTANVSKTFVLSLDNGRASTAGIFFFVPIYCEQDLDVFLRDIIGTPPYNTASELVYCQQNLTVLNRTP
jgi:hypothetical protein